MNNFPLPFKTRHLGKVPYEKILQQMQSFSASRQTETEDELWFVEHPSVFTQGKHGNSSHILSHSNIPLIQTDRGGQVTYHGEGQAIVYFLIDLKRAKLGIKDLVCIIEKSAILMLHEFNIESHLKDNAPGVYVKSEKICSLGLRVKQGKTYHGLSINVNMDLSPFKLINPCGYAGLKMTQISHFRSDTTIDDVNKSYLRHFSDKLHERLMQKKGERLCQL
ncbi:lipoyl(octanoyl) transferase LipB [Thiotrichales bacterium 19S9-12]|nr:lipoyl(octanoyl) transferase LipB [Thiotrichales bacterium 19S9-11]MCF6812088.1 lipoyl(octanoyl) transferase LipB [Thiotrichales bacterium 19S9-12]